METNFSFVQYILHVYINKSKLKWHYDGKSGCYVFLEKENIASNKHSHQIPKSDSIFFDVYFVVVFVYLTATIKKCPINEWGERERM